MKKKKKSSNIIWKVNEKKKNKAISNTIKAV